MYKRRLERLDRRLARSLAHARYQTLPQGKAYWERLDGMSYKELRAEHARLLAGRQREIEKLNGKLPPLEIPRDHPGWDFDTWDRWSWLLETRMGQRLDRDTADLVTRLSASRDMETRKRLDAEYETLLTRFGAVHSRCRQRLKTIEARQKAGRQVG